METVGWEQATARRMARHGLERPVARAELARQAGVVCGIHAQVMGAAELSLALRVEGATRADVRAALWEEQTLVKTYGPRGTVHLLPADELAGWIAALGAIPVPESPLPDGVRFDERQHSEVIAAIGDALADAELTTDELTEALVARCGAWVGERSMPAFQQQWPRWRQATVAAAHAGALCFGAPRGRAVTFTNPRRLVAAFDSALTAAREATAAERWAGGAGAGEPRAGRGGGVGAAGAGGAGAGEPRAGRGGGVGAERAGGAGAGEPRAGRGAGAGAERAGGALGDRDDAGRAVTPALAALVRRWLAAYGPATAAQFAQWAAAPRAWAGELFAALDGAGELTAISFEGEPAWVASGDDAFPDAAPDSVRLLPYYDAYGIGCHPRERLFPGRAAERALARGQAGPFPLLLLDGVVGGVWHQRRSGRSVVVTVEPLRRLGAARRAALAEQVERLGAIVAASPSLTIGAVRVGPHA
ncbi:DNA glycosylase AlkZ-like family protein [Conexibacter arvalis]|uniref:Winged helix DNA-binding domain-containing protein n=1 Tax=Conexibacter arvalis TaxID=912552 RepID=A0A840ID93_9ACTN|nr:crosslink repair DNA glycosylase YcaQ family protein [Conexibacter arvalis]MBB4662786.1 hypothetical protein [Conexibacter arvalis]